MRARGHRSRPAQVGQQNAVRRPASNYSVDGKWRSGRQARPHHCNAGASTRCKLGDRGCVNFQRLECRGSAVCILQRGARQFGARRPRRWLLHRNIASASITGIARSYLRTVIDASCAVRLSPLAHDFRLIGRNRGDVDLLWARALNSRPRRCNRCRYTGPRGNTKHLTTSARRRRLAPSGAEWWHLAWADTRPNEQRNAPQLDSSTMWPPRYSGCRPFPLLLLGAKLGARCDS